MVWITLFLAFALAVSSYFLGFSTGHTKGVNEVYNLYEKQVELYEELEKELEEIILKM